MAELPIATLIETHRKQLSITEADLVREMGYQNVSKGLRRLQALKRGDWATGAPLLDRLPMTLPTTPEASHGRGRGNQNHFRRGERAKARAASDELYRVNFQPHAVILTERDRPWPIFVAALMAAHGNPLILPLDLTQNPITFAGQAFGKLPTKVPAYGAVTGFVINFALDRAVQFDLTGNAVATLPQALRTGTARLTK